MQVPSPEGKQVLEDALRALPVTQGENEPHVVNTWNS